MAKNLIIKRGDLNNPKVIALLNAHREEMFKHSPPESVHALNLDGLKTPDVSFWVVWDGDEVAGCGALKDLGQNHGEIKSMRTATTHLRRGVASTMLDHIVQCAKTENLHRLSLETGSMDAFLPARLMYEKYGFEYTEPFADYESDIHSLFMTRKIS